MVRESLLQIMSKAKVLVDWMIEHPWGIVALVVVVLVLDIGFYLVPIPPRRRRKWFRITNAIASSIVCAFLVCLFVVLGMWPFAVFIVPAMLVQLRLQNKNTLFCDDCGAVSRSRNAGTAYRHCPDCGIPAES